MPRGYLSLLSVPDAPPINSSQSGRLELAYWLTSDQNVLASRVIVNRIWRHLFGRGLVSSVDNFGVTGDTPSHPDLLDHLAQEFDRQVEVESISDFHIQEIKLLNARTRKLVEDMSVSRSAV